MKKIGRKLFFKKRKGCSEEKIEDGYLMTEYPKIF